MLRTLKTTAKHWLAWMPALGAALKTALGAALSLLLLSACSTATTTPAAPTVAPTDAPTSAPTADLNLLRTEVAATVLAQCAQICALTPSATFTPSSTPTLSGTITPTGAAPTSGTPGSGNRLEWVAQNIADGTRMTAGTTFDITWRVRNVGTTTWTPNYLLRFYGGNRFGAPEEVPLEQEVAPGQEVDISISMQAPAAAGEYRSDWVMSDEARSNFNQPIYLEIVVVGAGTVVPTLPPPTQTNTPAPTQPVAETAEPTTEVTPTP